MTPKDNIETTGDEAADQTSASSSKAPRSSRRSGHTVSPTPFPVRRSLTQLGRDVATWRRLRGLTQAQVSSRAGVSAKTIKRLERGDGGITIENLLRVLRALGLLDLFPTALDPYESDVGRLRADEQLPQRVRPRRLSGRDDG